jgi:hypothetical protein
VNPTTFSFPVIGTCGNVGVGTLVRPGYFGINLGLFRDFPIRERQKIETRAEAFNRENRINLGSPDRTQSPRVPPTKLVGLSSLESNRLFQPYNPPRLSIGSFQTAEPESMAA